jgi:hypothetical protein
MWTTKASRFVLFVVFSLVLTIDCESIGNSSNSEHSERQLWLNFFHSLQAKSNDPLTSDPSPGEHCANNSCSTSDVSTEESQQHSHWQPISGSVPVESLPTSWFDSPIDKFMRRYALSSLDSSMLTVTGSPLMNQTIANDSSILTTAIVDKVKNGTNNTSVGSLNSESNALGKHLHKFLIEQLQLNANQGKPSPSNSSPLQPLDNRFMVYPPGFDMSIEDELSDPNETSDFRALPSSRSNPKTSETRPVQTRYRQPSTIHLDPPMRPDSSARPAQGRRPSQRPSFRHRLPAEFEPNLEQPLKAVRHRPMTGGFRPSPFHGHSPPDYSYSHMMHLMQNQRSRNPPTTRPKHLSHLPAHHHQHHHHSSLQHPHNSYYPAHSSGSQFRRPSSGYSADLDRATTSTSSDHQQVRAIVRGRNQPNDVLSSHRSMANAYGKRINPSERTLNDKSHLSREKQNGDQPEMQEPNSSDSSTDANNSDLNNNPIDGNGDSMHGNPMDSPPPSNPIESHLAEPIQGSRTEEYRPDDLPLDDHRRVPPEMNTELIEDSDVDVDGNRLDPDAKSKPYPSTRPSAYSYSQDIKHKSSNKRPTWKSRTSFKTSGAGNMKHYKNYALYDKYGRNGDSSVELPDEPSRAPFRPSEEDELSTLTMSAKAAAMAGEFSTPSSGPSVPMGGFYYPYYKHGRKPSPFDSSHMFGSIPAWSNAFEPFESHRYGYPVDKYGSYESGPYDLRPMDAKMSYMEGTKLAPNSAPNLPLFPPGHLMPPPPPPPFALDPPGPKGPPAYLLPSRQHAHEPPYHHHMHSDIHHHPHHDSKQNGFGSWQSGLVGFLLGVVPFSMLMASVVPAMGAMGGATALAPLGKRRRRKRRIPTESEMHSDLQEWGSRLADQKPETTQKWSQMANKAMQGN